MMKNVFSEMDGRYGDKNGLELLQWLMSNPVFANTIHQLTRIEPTSRAELKNARSYSNERLLFRLKKSMKKNSGNADSDWLPSEGQHQWERKR